MYGTNILVTDLKSIIKDNDVCNRLGLDTISAGACVAFVMECFEKGILTKKDIGFDRELGRPGSRCQTNGNDGQAPRSGSFRTTVGASGPRRQLGDQLLDLALGPVRGPLQERLAVLPGQVRRQLRNGGQVKAPLAQHRRGARGAAVRRARP